MAALWGGGAGHAGAGGTFPLRAGAESVVGSGLSSTQYLLAEDLHLASLEAETILEAEELLGTMQDYLDSSVISLIEDFSSLTETKSRTDADNELSLLTAITEILDSTDDESLSPFDTLPDSELLASPRERDNSSFQKFLSLSMTPPEQDFHANENFQEPRICSIKTEIEASPPSLSLVLPPACPKDLATSKKSTSKMPWVEWRLFRHREREPPVVQRSDGEEEEEEEETTGCEQAFVTGVKESPAASVLKEVEADLTASDGPYVIAPESISLRELVRTMHTYCQPTATLCRNLKGQPLVALEGAPDDGESMELPVVVQSMEAKLSCPTGSHCGAGKVNEGAVLAIPAPESMPPPDNAKVIGLERESPLSSQVVEVGKTAALQEVDGVSGGNQEDKSQPFPAASVNIKVNAPVKGQRSGHSRKKRRRSTKEIKQHKEAKKCRLPSASGQQQVRTDLSRPIGSSGPDLDCPEKLLEKESGLDQGESLLTKASPTRERLDAGREKMLKTNAEQGPQNTPAPHLASAKALPKAAECPSLCNQREATPVCPDHQADVQEPNRGHNLLSPVGSETSQFFPGRPVDVEGQPSRSPLNIGSEKVIHAAKETKPKPLSLSEYRQRRQQCQPSPGSSSGARAKQSASKWPCLPELPTKLADLPCLKVLPPPTKPAAPGLARKPEKLIGSSSIAPASSAIPPTVPAPAASLAPKVAPLFQDGCRNTAPPLAPLPVVPPLPSKIGVFPPVSSQVLQTLPLPFLTSPPGTFLPAPPNPYILGSPPPVPPWTQFAPLPSTYQSLPPPHQAPEACLPAFRAIPPVPPPPWPHPPVPVPSFGPGLPYNSAEWVPGQQASYWSGIPVPPPMLPIPYGNQSALMQNHPVGTYSTASLSDGMLGQSNCRAQNLKTTENPALQAQAPQAQAHSAAQYAPRRVSDPRKQVQATAAESKAEVRSCKLEAVGKQSSLQTTEPLGEATLTQSAGKSCISQSLEKLHSVPPSQQVRESTGMLTSIEEPSLVCTLQPSREVLAVSGPLEKVCPTTIKEASPSLQAQDERFSLPAALVPEEVAVPAVAEVDAKEAAITVLNSPATAVPLKTEEIGQLTKKPAHMWKRQPLINIAQHSRNKDIVQAFITEIGIEASDLSSLLEQFEKTEEEASGVVKSRGNVSSGNNGAETQQEKKAMDRLQAPELTNIAGLTPPATPPHQLWKPLSAVSLLGKAGSLKGAKLVKPLSKWHRKPLVPLHVGSGEHDYCQRNAAQPKWGSRWNVKHNSDITIKPIKALTERVSDKPPTNQPPTAARLDHVDILSSISTIQNSKEAPSRVGGDQGQIQAFDSSAASSSLGTSALPLLENNLAGPHSKPLDHRTNSPKSATRSNDDPCSVLLSPAASPCRDAEGPSQLSQEVQQKRLASKRSLRCYRSRQKSTSPPPNSWTGRRNRASRSFSSSSDGESDSSSSSSISSSSSRSCSRSLSPPSKRWRRYRASSSRSSSRGRSRGSSPSSTSSTYLSRSSSRSPSPYRRGSCRKRYDSSHSRDGYQRQKIRYKERAIEERRVVFIGKIPSRMTRSELQHRFSVFGDIEDCTLHFREHGDNYGFVTYRYAEEAFAAIEGGQALCRPDEQPFDLCFGGRRQFCKRNYADLDSYREDFEPASMKSKFDSLDFDTLLKQAQRSLRR